MGARHATKDRQMRERIAQEAARIMAEQQVTDFFAAKRKAAERLGASDTRNLPRNVEVEAALRDYQRLFQGERREARLRALRAAALDAMRFLERFRPRLVGSVLRGTAHDESDVNLHIFAETSEEVAMFLMDEDVPFESSDRRLRMSSEGYTLLPSYRFERDGVSIDVTVFPLDGAKHSPLSPVDGRPMDRAGPSAVEELLSD